ncbi:hypothetical protein [Thioclava sp. IC9]|uniref:hypothetical protein n=1 Tax=Thioclava sp. IC9 TaxID=1973007 RepID=UPI001131990C|nr:hypothetical protein [Thioclava sp. IC9]
MKSKIDAKKRKRGGKTNLTKANDQHGEDLAAKVLSHPLTPILAALLCGVFIGYVMAPNDDFGSLVRSCQEVGRKSLKQCYLGAARILYETPAPNSYQ